MAFGTIFSTLAGNPSCRTLGTFESPVACDTLPVSLLLLVSCAESGTWCSMLEGTCQSYQSPMYKAVTSRTDLFLHLLGQLWVCCVRDALAFVVLHICICVLCFEVWTWLWNSKAVRKGVRSLQLQHDAHHIWGVRTPDSRDVEMVLPAAADVIPRRRHLSTAALPSLAKTRAVIMLQFNPRQAYA